LNSEVKSASRFSEGAQWFVLLTIGITILLVSIFFLGKRYVFFLQTRHWFPIHKVEHLNLPIQVIRWTEDGLQLSDGRMLPLPGFKKLPLTSSALAEATQGGVEITTDGRVIGLVEIHHWCGNDPVRKHIARVDIAHLLRFLKQGEPSGPFLDEEIIPENGLGVETSGWDPSSFMLFKSWSESQSRERSPSS